MVELDEYSAAMVIELLESDDQLEKIIEQFHRVWLINNTIIHLGLRMKVANSSPNRLRLTL